MDDLQRPCGVTLFQPIRDDHFKRLMVRKTSGTLLAFRANSTTSICSSKSPQKAETGASKLSDASELQLQLTSRSGH